MMNRVRSSMKAAAAMLTILLALSVLYAPAAGAGPVGTSDPGPHGNNGTVKVDGRDTLDGPGHTDKLNDPADDGTDNDPHVSCGFELEFFNFDTGQLADVVFTAHAPTGNNGLLFEDSIIIISDDATAGAANDLDAVREYDVLKDFNTGAFTTTHAVHGWHVKLTLTVYDAAGKTVPGASKHKVFWVENCAPEQAPCLDGQVLDTETGECGAVVKGCPEGEVMDAKTAECGAVVKGCPEGEVMDARTGECDTVVTPATCPDGKPMTDVNGDGKLTAALDCVNVLTDVVTPVTAVTPVTPAQPGTPVVPATPATPATPAEPVATVLPDAVTPNVVPTVLPDAVTPNVVPTVLPDAVTPNVVPIVAPAPAPVEADTAVLGAQVQRAPLARTGSSSTGLAAFGALLVLLGASATVAGRRTARS